jgi:hypothetical protein
MPRDEMKARHKTDRNKFLGTGHIFSLHWMGCSSLLVCDAVVLVVVPFLTFRLFRCAKLLRVWWVFRVGIGSMIIP